VAQLAQAEAEARPFHNPSPIYHGIAPDFGALVAFRVKPGSWLVILFPNEEPLFPLLSICLLSVLLLLLLTGFEWNRRRAVAAQDQAVSEFEEKQNLLETMQVPLMVVDPNTEHVVYSNKAALLLGIQVGGRFPDVIAGDEALAHYQQMQVAAPHDRRAYGLPLKMGDETRYAVIRSVAVKAPIHMIGADERHRLGILFLIEEQADLSLLTGPLTDRVMEEERRKLSGLLNHGVDTLARLLNHRLERGDNDAFNVWLSGYIQRRIRVVAWLLEQWDASPIPAGTALIQAGNAQATLQRLGEAFAFVRESSSLRSQLHWNNGTLSGPFEPGEAVFETLFNWPGSFSFSLPVRGGLGFFLGEVLVNAIRHGVPGDKPQVKVHCDRLTGELLFQISNRMGEHRSQPADQPGKKYGGKSILVQLARLFGWSSISFKQVDDVYSVCWSVAVSEAEMESD